jgi:hypothetical protein
MKAPAAHNSPEARSLLSQTVAALSPADQKWIVINPVEHLVTVGIASILIAVLLYRRKRGIDR